MAPRSLRRLLRAGPNSVAFGGQRDRGRQSPATRGENVPLQHLPEPEHRVDDDVVADGPDRVLGANPIASPATSSIGRSFAPSPTATVSAIGMRSSSAFGQRVIFRPLDERPLGGVP